MSQENQNTQSSSDSPTRQTSSQKNPPFWKGSLIKALRGTIGVLETTAVKLETESPAGSEEKTGFLQKLQQPWSGILRKIRLILPARFSAKLSDTALTGIVGGLTVMVFLITSSVFGSKPSQIATVTPNTEIPPVVSTTKPESIPSEEETVSLPPTEVAITKQQEEIPPIIEQKTFSEKELASLPPELEIHQEQQQEIPLIIEEQKSSASDSETVSLAPQSETVTEQQEEISPSEEFDSASIPLTPEESLIVIIQNQITSLSDSEIIESIQANFLSSNLTIKMRNDWYNLEKIEQDKIAAEILQRSQELDFTHMEITDGKGKLLARNPVVGTEMIIFKRK